MKEGRAGDVVIIALDKDSLKGNRELTIPIC